jgi:hypothetical protein
LWHIALAHGHVHMYELFGLAGGVDKRRLATFCTLAAAIVLHIFLGSNNFHLKNRIIHFLPQAATRLYIFSLPSSTLVDCGISTSVLNSNSSLE